MENKLKTYRLEIEKIDKAMIDLLIARFDICDKIGAYKKKVNLPIEDKKREQELLQQYLSFLPKKYQIYYQNIFQEILKCSKSIQER